MQDAGGVGHDSQSVPEEIFARVHFDLIAEQQASPRAKDDLEIWLIGLFAFDCERNLESDIFTKYFAGQLKAVDVLDAFYSIHKDAIFSAQQRILGIAASRYG